MLCSIPFPHFAMQVAQLQLSPPMCCWPSGKLLGGARKEPRPPPLEAGFMLAGEPLRGPLPRPPRMPPAGPRPPRPPTSGGTLPGGPPLPGLPLPGPLHTQSITRSKKNVCYADSPV